MRSPVISLSTSYLQPKFPDSGYDMMCEAAAMGFEYVELGHSTPVSSTEGILRALDEGIVKVSSLHNFCPIPPWTSGAQPNLFSPASKSKKESELWRRHTLNTAAFAAKTKAQAIVCHCGNLEYFFLNPARRVLGKISTNGYAALGNDAEYKKLASSYMLSAGKKAEKNGYKNIFENVSAIAGECAANNLDLGLENREGADELPLDWNIDALLGMFENTPNVYAWHDIGHSKKKELALLADQFELIERTLPKIRGWHLHDCDADGHDHIAVGRGCIDFKKLSKYFDPQRHIFTLELNRRVLRKDAADSLKRIQDLF